MALEPGEVPNKFTFRTDRNISEQTRLETEIPEIMVNVYYILSTFYYILSTS